VAACDCCGKHYTFGALKTGSRAFCSSVCQERGQLLTALDRLPPAQLELYVEKAHRADCPTCERPGPVDIRHSYWVWSLLFLTRWDTEPRIECARCGRIRQVKALAFSLAAGWWGIPFGLFLTPTQIVRNLIALAQSNDRPSADFRRTMLFDLAREMSRSDTADTRSAVEFPPRLRPMI
jgi:hypothetical protein